MINIEASKASVWTLFSQIIHNDFFRTFQVFFCPKKVKNFYPTFHHALLHFLHVFLGDEHIVSRRTFSRHENGFWCIL